MSHEENKNDSQVYSPAVNTINFIFIIGRHSFIHQTFTEPYYVPDLCWALGIRGGEGNGFLIPSSSHPGVGCGRQALNKSGMAVHPFPRATVTKCNRLDDLNNITLFSHRPGDWKSKISVLARSVPSESSEGDSVPWSVLDSGDSWLPLASLGLSPHHPHLCLHHRMPPHSPCVSCLHTASFLGGWQS